MRNYSGTPSFVQSDNIHATFLDTIDHRNTHIYRDYWTIPWRTGDAHSRRISKSLVHASANAANIIDANNHCLLAPRSRRKVAPNDV